MRGDLAEPARRAAAGCVAGYVAIAVVWPVLLDDAGAGGCHMDDRVFFPLVFGSPLCGTLFGTLGLAGPHPLPGKPEDIWVGAACGRRSTAHWQPSCSRRRLRPSTAAWNEFPIWIYHRIPSAGRDGCRRLTCASATTSSLSRRRKRARSRQSARSNYAAHPSRNLNLANAHCGGSVRLTAGWYSRRLKRRLKTNRTNLRYDE